MEQHLVGRVATFAFLVPSDQHFVDVVHVLLFDLRLAEAEAEFKRAVDLDPKTPYVREFLVWLYIFMDRPREALEAARRGVADNPSSPTAIAEEARALLVNGRCADAMPLLGRLMYLQPPPARVGAIAALGEIGGEEAREALIYALEDKREAIRQAAAAALEELEFFEDPLGT